MNSVSRRSIIIGGTAALGLSALASPALAGPARNHLVLDYRPQQPTGWPQAPGQAIGGHTIAKDFVYQGNPHRISLLGPDPAYADLPADPEVRFQEILESSWGAHYSFRYRGGFRSRSVFRVLTYGVFAEEPTQTSPMRYGGGLHVTYEPAGGDPPLSPNLQWIQVVNWRSSHGSIPSEVDSSWRANPFYPYGGHTSVNGTETVSFYDVPSKGIMGPSALDDHLTAETFLVADRGNGIVDIYGGVRWGWKITQLV
ncbi:MAG TPA: hypothetical protein DGT23_20380 [Micromonosporaceae bacterium]|nr:hypothetical protein [Micromonosporaceae bacterium]